MISGIFLSTLLQSSPISNFLVSFPLGLLDILDQLPYFTPDLRWSLGVVLIGSLLVHTYNIRSKNQHTAVTKQKRNVVATHASPLKKFDVPRSKQGIGHPLPVFVD